MTVIKILYILAAVLIFGIIIFIHEFGHYIFARIFKVKIFEFAIGMGPKIFSRSSKKTGISYSLRLLPFGGFVSMAGEDEDSDDENAFCNKHVLKRIVITAAGAFVNVVVGIIVMSIVVLSLNTYGTTAIAEFEKREGVVCSDDFGLDVGDVIIKVDGTRVYTANDLSYELMRSGINPVDLTVRRNGDTVVIKDVTFPTITEQGTLFGSPDFKVYGEDKNFVSTAKNVFARSRLTIKMVYDSLYDLVTGRYSMESVSGPVGVTEALGEAAGRSGADFIYLAAFISINVGIMNLLPLPALDGGRLLFQLIELVVRKPIPRKIEGIIHFAGLALLMLLLVIITLKDVISLF